MKRAVGLRRFTDAGIQAFASYLDRLRAGEIVAPPVELLEDDRFAIPLGDGRLVEPRSFASRYDFARYADRLLAPEEPDTVFNDVYLWSWLSLFYFDQVCPERGGVRKPGRDYRHIPEPGFPFGHRHLLGGAYLVYSVYGLRDDLAEFLLYGPMPTETQAFHQIVSRQSLVTNDAVIEAARRLYYDRNAKRPRRGVFQTKSPGGFIRFITLIQQLDVTYDLYSMTWERIFEILPAEFDQWKG